MKELSRSERFDLLIAIRNCQFNLGDLSCDIGGIYSTSCAQGALNRLSENLLTLQSRITRLCPDLVPVLAFVPQPASTSTFTPSPSPSNTPHPAAQPTPAP